MEIRLPNPIHDVMKVFLIQAEDRVGISENSSFWSPTQKMRGKCMGCLFHYCHVKFANKDLQSCNKELRVGSVHWKTGRKGMTLSFSSQGLLATALSRNR